MAIGDDKRWPARDVLSPVLHKGDEKHWQGMYIHYCPACKSTHIFAVDKPQANGAQWRYNGNPVAPTFEPSMRITWPQYRTDTDGTRHEIGTRQCHYIITDGVINFCADSTHAMAGQQVHMQEIPVNA